MGLHPDLSDQSSLSYSDFKEVADMLTVGYQRLVDRGLSGQMVAYAILGATVNLYDIFGLSHDLPHLFRELADRIESKEFNGTVRTTI